MHCWTSQQWHPHRRFRAATACEGRLAVMFATIHVFANCCACASWKALRCGSARGGRTCSCRRRRCLSRLAVLPLHPEQLGRVSWRSCGRRAARCRKGQIIALDGEAGYQAELLRGGMHFGYWRWQYRVHKVRLVTISQGKIGYVYARDGEPLPPSQTLGPARRVQQLSGRPRVPHGHTPKRTAQRVAASAAGSARSCAKACTRSTRPCSS